jgi:hypothetical protein
MNRRIGVGSPLAAVLRLRRERRGLRVASRALCTAALGLTLTAAIAAASGSPQGPPAGPKSPQPVFTQCPPAGIDSGCEYLIDVTNLAVPPTVVRDSNQSFYDREDDVLVAVQNDTSVDLPKIHIGVPGSGDRLFELDGDGICWTGLEGPKPVGCPFNPQVTYDGPDAELQPESADAGTVTFPTPLKPGQYTFFSLEAPPTVALVAGAVNDTVATTLTNQQTHESGIALAAPAPAPITDRATIKGEHGSSATGSVEYVVYSDPSCTKPAELLGTKKVVNGVAESSNASGRQLPTNATYYWVAKYSGDANNSPNSSACGSETMSFGSPPAPAATLPGANGASVATLKLILVRLNENNGQISVTAILPGAGVLTASAVVKAGATLASVTSVDAQAATKCKRGSVLRHGRCVSNAPVFYGVRARNAASPGAYTLLIKPTKRVLAALRKGKRPLVTVTVNFQSIPGNRRLSAVRTLVARLKHHKH